MSLSTSGYEDGLGRRTLIFDREAGTMLERLRLRPELNAFEAALRKRIARVESFEDERFARVREIERDPASGGLTVVSEFVSGYRLSDLLDAAIARHGDDDAPGLDVALGFLLEVLPALVSLHGIGGFTHGAIGPGRTILTPSGQVVLLDCIFGETLQRLQFTRARLWREFRTALPPAAGPVRFDVAADLSQVSVMAMMLVLGRPLADNEYPDGLTALREEVVEIAQIRGSATFSRAIEQFLERTVPGKVQNAYGSADEAAAEVRAFTQEIGLLRCRIALRTFISRMSGAEAPPMAKRAATPAPARRAERPAPVAPPDPVEIDLEIPLDLAFEPTHPLADAAEFHTLSTADAAYDPIDESIDPGGFEADAVAIDLEPASSVFVEETPEPVAYSDAGYDSRIDPTAYAEPPLAEYAAASDATADLAGDYAPEAVFEEAIPIEAAPVVEYAEPCAEAEPPAEEILSVVDETPRVEPTFVEDRAILEEVILEEPVIYEEAALVEDQAPIVAPVFSAHPSAGDVIEQVFEPAVMAPVEAPTPPVFVEPEPVAAAAPVSASRAVEPPPVAVHAEPPVVAITVEPPVVAPPPPPAVESKRKRGSVRKSKRDKLRSVAPEPVKAAAPPPPPPAPVQYAPPPPPAPIPMPVHYSPGAPAPISSYNAMAAPSWQTPAPAAITPQPIASIALAPSAPLRIKATPPAGYQPPPMRVEREAFVHTHRGSAHNSGGFPWKFVAAAVVLALVGVGATAGRQYLPGRKTTAARTAPSASTTAAPVQPTAPVNDTGTLVIATQPAGAKILIDGKPAGESPLTVDAITAGHHVLTFVTASGSIRKPIRIEPDKTLSVDVPVYSGWVAVFSPIRLDIAEKGQSIGSTDQGRLMLSPGTHTLTLSNREYSYSSVQSVIIESGEERSISVRPRGSASFNASPWAEVWVDGEKMGETPLANLQLMLGTRNVVFKHPQFGERRMTAIITATSPTVVSIDFSKPPNQ